MLGRRRAARRSSAPSAGQRAAHGRRESIPSAIPLTTVTPGGAEAAAERARHLESVARGAPRPDDRHRLARRAAPAAARGRRRRGARRAAASRSRSGPGSGVAAGRSARARPLRPRSRAAAASKPAQLALELASRRSPPTAAISSSSASASTSSDPVPAGPGDRPGAPAARPAPGSVAGAVTDRAAEIARARRPSRPPRWRSAERASDVVARHPLAPAQVGDRPRHAQHPVAAAGAERAAA